MPSVLSVEDDDADGGRRGEESDVGSSSGAGGNDAGVDIRKACVSALISVSRMPHGILKTISHNFITKRCSGEQMAVGINVVRAICSRGWLRRRRR